MTKTFAVAIALALQISPPIFRFEADGFWLNLHHFLYVLSRAQAATPDSKRAAVIGAPIDQADGLTHLSAEERKVWTDAVTFYANGPGKMDAVFDNALIDITNAMRVPPRATSSALKIDPALRATLERAAPIYRRLWWPRHQQANNERVRELVRQLEEHGDHVRAYLTKAYQLEWPVGGHIVNVSGYTNWAGAYSTSRGNLIVIASLDPQVKGYLGLESIFHEASHQWDDAMIERLVRLSKANQTPPLRNGLTHALIWYTVNEAVKSRVPSHRGWAETLGMWNQNPNRVFKPGLDTYWKPYLDGKITLDEALIGLLKS
jgi:hypothetical protein